MFENLAFASSPGRSIRLDTRTGKEIENEQSLPPDQRTVSIFQRIVQQHPQWSTRKECCGTYNCFGHVWASRRTCIFKSGQVWRIFQEDGYREIDHSKATRGDIAVYLMENSTDIWHAGVIELRDIVTEGTNSIGTVPWVLSKLNAVMGEVFHPLKDVHAPFRFDVQIWTDKYAR